MIRVSTPSGQRCLWLLVALSACECGDPDRLGDAPPDGGRPPGGGDGDGATGACVDDQVLCEGSTARICDGRGGFKEEIDCGGDGMACASSTLSRVTGEWLALGCVACEPGTTRCGEGVGEYCPEDGSGFVRFECDPLQGLACEPSGCVGRCAPPEAKHSYIGCDYYPTVTLNPVWRGFDFAVSVANAGDRLANITITRDEQMIATSEVAVGGIEVIPLAWVPELKGDDVDACQIAPDPGATRISRGGAYRLRSDQPVTVHQFSPLQYQLMDDDGDAPAGCPLGVECDPSGTTECLSYSNDASLLLPATSLTGDYTVMSWPSLSTAASFYAVTATEDGTQVVLAGSAQIATGAGLSNDGSGSVRLDRGDVLQVVAGHAGRSGSDDLNADVSGTRIQADKPVQVIGGNSCAKIPDAQAGQCDHVEQALFPSQILGDQYVVSYPAAVASKSPHVLRIAAVRPDTMVELDPPIVPPFALSPGDEPRFIRIGAYERDGDGSQDPRDIHITASEPIVVAQYMQGLSSVPSGSGDPSMALAVPVAQYRDSYVFTAPTSYDTNFINVIAPDGARIQLDGIPLAERSTPAGSSGYSVMRVELPTDGSESHSLEADTPVGLVVYGYGRYTSYMYPGGLDLKPITRIGPL